MEHALALTLQQITGSQQNTACTHQNICHPVGGTGLDQLAALRAGIQFFHPSPIFCTDNAAMIGAAAYYEYKKGARAGWDLNAVPNLKLGER